ncbi:MAG: phosphoribosylformylglycinamidine cyclo-ligase [Firmicutes bacterium]|nr:phosphoribosylformylglycinamidine cyclo-ligase [Bacillota bacterium]
MAIDYKDAGVDVEAGYKAVELMKKHVKRTYNGNVMGDLGSFGGFYSIADDKSKEPVLVAGTDGVGTKLKLAFALDKHDTIGIDCVAMCVNDIVCQGARPLFFLDYLATGKLEPKQAEQIVKGIADGCVESGCALIGGETAEMPGFYEAGEYDLAGFAVGIVDKSKVINGSKIKAGDALIGLASSGVHSNGFSLIRKIFGETKEELAKDNIGETLLTPTRLYVKTIMSLIAKFDIKGIAHITGGGFIENIPRIFPKGIGGEVSLSSYPKGNLFELITQKSELSNQKLYNTFNMGIGMVLCIDPKDADKVIAAANALGEKAYLIGKTVKGEGLKLNS